MRILVHLITNGSAAALLHFLKTAIEFQEMDSTVIATDETDREFFETHGYTKKDLQDAVNALKRALE